MMIAEHEKAGGLAVRSTAQDLRAAGRNGAGARAHVNVGPMERVASAALGGTLLAVAAGRSGVSRALLGLLGSGLFYRGVSGHCPVYQRLGASTAQAPRDDGSPRGPGLDAPEVQRSITIGRPPAELLALWQKPEVQARIMAHFAEVTAGANGNLRWSVRVPLGKALSFETARVEERAGELVRWRSVGSGDLQSEWSVLAREAPGKYGSELTLQVRFDPPGGVWGMALSKLLGGAPRLLVERALRNFKSLVEAGEIPSTFHNPSARRGARSNTRAPHALAAAH
jgi:uncharacterized membrane protein